MQRFLGAALASLAIVGCGAATTNTVTATQTVTRTQMRYHTRTRTKVVIRHAPAPPPTTVTVTATTTTTQTIASSAPPATPAVEAPGSFSHATDAEFCTTHSCIENFPNGDGYIVQCSDGEWSHSGGLSGACSDHGGEG